MPLSFTTPPPGDGDLVDIGLAVLQASRTRGESGDDRRRGLERAEEPAAVPERASSVVKGGSSRVAGVSATRRDFSCAGAGLG